MGGRVREGLDTLARCRGKEAGKKLGSASQFRKGTTGGWGPREELVKAWTSLLCNFLEGFYAVVAGG